MTTHTQLQEYKVISGDLTTTISARTCKSAATVALMLFPNTRFDHLIGVRKTWHEPEKTLYFNTSELLRQIPEEVNI
jgi:hypothetical protein